MPQLCQGRGLFYWDKFGEADFEKAVKVMFRWAYWLRIKQYSIYIESINNHAIGNNGLPMFEIISRAIHPKEITQLRLPNINIGWCLNSKFSIFISLLNIILVDKNMNSRNVHCLLLRETQALTNKPTHSSPDSRITTLYMACFTPILATFMQTWIKGFIIGFPHIAFGDEVLITWRNVCAKLLTGFDASITNIITDYLFCSTT